MSVVTGALGSLTPKLLQLLRDEYKLQKGVKKQVRWLSDELNSIYAFLSKVAEVPWDRLDEQVKVWAREVREASYDMEDILDAFLVRVDGGDPADPSRLKRSMKKMGKVFSRAKARRHQGASRGAERRLKYKLDDIMSKPTATTSTIDPRLTAMYKEVSQLIGVDKSRDELISVLTPSELDGDRQYKNITKKISIVGVGGLGKTTLAKAVYDKLKSQFECGAFVSVGRELDLVKVFKDILFNLDKVKYFIVVDDVWEVKTWERIRLALVENNCGSRVITTTRKFDVAQESGEVYKLQPLSHENSKRLLYTGVLGATANYEDDQPDDVSNKILKKCAGIPLAIITMSSLLVGKPNNEWSEVYDTISFGHDKGNSDVEDTMTILSFSYYDLPSHLRTCLLYLSAYPEDYLVDKDSLIWKWIAEGFVNGKEGKILFEVGERYFNDLINRSMIQAEENKRTVIVVSCRVHDMVLDLIRKFSLEENFIAALDCSVEVTSSPSNARRLALQNRAPEHINIESMVIKVPKVGSYTAFKCHIDNMVRFSSFELLRVLDMIDCRFKEGCHLEHLGNLQNLRYLGLRHYHIPKLPKQIGDLKLLQTLIVSELSALPVSIIVLTQLLHLDCGYNLPEGIGKLTSLQKLRIGGGPMDNPERYVKELGRLLELRVLEFRLSFNFSEMMQRYFVESLHNLQMIQHISVTGTFYNIDTTVWEEAGFVLPRPLRYLSLVCIYFSKLPSCINGSCLPNLSSMDLGVATMDEQDLSSQESAVTASNINAGHGFFPKLRCFRICGGMVQFEQPIQEDSSVSVHIWNGRGPTPFGSRKSNCSKLVPSAVVMPNLQVLAIMVDLRYLKDNNCDCGNFGFEYLPSLQEVCGVVNCYGVSTAEGDAALAALRNACAAHPNHPTLEIVLHTHTDAPHDAQDGLQSHVEEDDVSVL
ncbi:LOW QUALITY PROTEIN: hypothetical protein U9M48_001285 [Paspalum notatum var. saurae]|uniref:Uncharacterized protein n=1 Tax=Paspalum notatum var. saurae TaxID=547442 RepID=A0AAQ3PFQ7_PASNO